MSLAMRFMSAYERLYTFLLEVQLLANSYVQQFSKAAFFGQLIYFFCALYACRGGVVSTVSVCVLACPDR